MLEQDDEFEEFRLRSFSGGVLPSESRRRALFKYRTFVGETIADVDEDDPCASLPDIMENQLNPGVTGRQWSAPASYTGTHDNSCDGELLQELNRLAIHTKRKHSAPAKMMESCSQLRADGSYDNDHKMTPVRRRQMSMPSESAGRKDVELAAKCRVSCEERSPRVSCDQRSRRMSCDERPRRVSCDERSRTRSGDERSRKVSCDERARRMSCGERPRKISGGHKTKKVACDKRSRRISCDARSSAPEYTDMSHGVFSEGRPRRVSCDERSSRDEIFRRMSCDERSSHITEYRSQCEDNSVPSEMVTSISGEGNGDHNQPGQLPNSKGSDPICDICKTVKDSDVSNSAHKTVEASDTSPPVVGDVELEHLSPALFSYVSDNIFHLPECISLAFRDIQCWNFNLHLLQLRHVTLVMPFS